MADQGFQGDRKCQKISWNVIVEANGYGRASACSSLMGEKGVHSMDTPCNMLKYKDVLKMFPLMTGLLYKRNRKIAQYHRNRMRKYSRSTNVQEP